VLPAIDDTIAEINWDSIACDSRDFLVMGDPFKPTTTKSTASSTNRARLTDRRATTSYDGQIVRRKMFVFNYEHSSNSR
jgi:hypothetical protein